PVFAACLMISVAATVLPEFMHVPPIMTTGAERDSRGAGGRAPSEIFKTFPSALHARPTTSTWIASEKDEWWPLHRPITPPIFRRCRESPAWAVGGTSPTKPLSARR